MPSPPPPLLPGQKEVSSVTYGFTTTDAAFDTAAAAAGIANTLGVDADTVTVTIGAGGVVTVSIDAADATAAANMAGQLNSIEAADIATAIGAPAGSVSGVTESTATTETAGAPPPSPPPPPPPSPLNPGESQTISVTWGFTTNDAAFDAAAAKLVIANQLKIGAADVTVTVAGGVVTVSIYAGDTTAAADMAGQLNSYEPATLVAALSAPAGSVSALQAAAVVVVTVAPPPSPSPPAATGGVAASPLPTPPSPSPPPSPPWMPPGKIAVATHKFTLKVTDTATRRRRLGEMTPELVKTELVKVLQEEGLSLGGDDGELISVDVTLTAQVVAVAPLFARTFAVEIVARAEHSDAVAKQINEPNFKTTLASSDHLGTSVLFEDIKPIAYSSVNVAPPAVAATPAPTPEPKQLKGLGESNISSAPDERGYWAFLPGGLFLLCPLLVYIYARYRYGAGKTYKWLRWKCSHTNPVTPILYLPKDVKERMRAELNSSEV